MVRVPPCHGGCCGFEPRRSRHINNMAQATRYKYKSGIRKDAFFVSIVTVMICAENISSYEMKQRLLKKISFRTGLTAYTVLYYWII